MVKTKTHFEQVPVAQVKKALEKQDRTVGASSVLCAICNAPVTLEHCKIDEDGGPVHDACYTKKVIPLPKRVSDHKI